MSTIGLLNGQLFDYENPDPAAIDLETMAHVLGGVPRFGGHTIRFVYLDEHSSRVGRFARLTAELLRPDDVRMHDLCELHGNLHDGHEAYTPWGDITDGKTDEMRAIEAGLDAAIFQRLGVEPTSDLIKAIVKQADKRALWIEARLWAPSSPCWTDLEPPPPSVLEPLLILTWPRRGECWLRRTRELLAVLGPGSQLKPRDDTNTSTIAAGSRVLVKPELAPEGSMRPGHAGIVERVGFTSLGRPLAVVQHADKLQVAYSFDDLLIVEEQVGPEPVHFDPEAVAKGMFPTHIGPRGARYSDGTVLSPSIVDDFERLKQVTDARALLRAKAWIEGDPGEWFPAASETITVNINRECSPEILRALAILAEEARP